ncbi:MAG: hypothetical protein CMP06_14610 [Xanthomonadales bacterium]|nr:hypothetical protein [Xanthomonadales bacterium]
MAVVASDRSVLDLPVERSFEAALLEAAVLGRSQEKGTASVARLSSKRAFSFVCRAAGSD